MDERSKLLQPILFPLLIEWFFYLIATANILLVVFDLTYLEFRTFYLTNDYLSLEPVVKLYDFYKGAEPNLYTQKYIDTAQDVKSRYIQNPQDPEIPKLLLDLQAQSKDIIDKDPFARVGRTGSLERIKNRIRTYMGNESSTQSFKSFWSLENINRDKEAFSFYEKKLEPLFKSNYYREYGEDGEFIDKFWQIDLYFIGIFAAELLIRGVYISRRAKIGFRQALSTRWYDFFWLIFTVHWGWLRLLRLIPYIIRSDQLGTPVDKIVDYINDRYSIILADKVSELVVLQIIDQIENTIRRTNYLDGLQPSSSSKINYKLDGFIDRQSQILVDSVLPDLKPEVVQLIHHVLTAGLEDNPAYQVLQKTPVLGKLPNAALERFIGNIYGAILNIAKDASTDSEGKDLTEQLVRKFSEKFAVELRTQNIDNEVRDILIAVLEEVKQNYLRQRRL
ncbi:MAG: hypothetical protein WCA07_15135 [Gloeobacterales cyanobacterium]